MLVIQHYPGLCPRAVFENALPLERRGKAPIESRTPLSSVALGGIGDKVGAGSHGRGVSAGANGAGAAPPALEGPEERAHPKSGQGLLATVGAPEIESS